MNQGIIVYVDNDQYKAITRITHETIVSSTQADETIQAALNAAGEKGGQVFIEQGIYPLSKSLEVQHRVRLSGAGRGTRLEVSGEAGVVLQKADSAEVADLAIVAVAGSEAKAGLILDSCGDCQITNVFAGGFEEHGIWMRNHSFMCTIRGCSAAGNEKSNICLDTLAMSGRAGRYLPNLVADCMVYGGGVGIEVRRAVVLNILGCCIFQTRDSGFHVHTGSNSVVISSCRTFQVGKHAVQVEDSDEFNLNGNILCWHIEDGVMVRNAHWGSIAGNEIIDSGSYNSGVEDRTAPWDQLPEDLPPYCGVRLFNVQGYNISSNTIFNWGVCPPMEYGVFEDTQCFKNIITANNINFFVKQDVLSQGHESSSINNMSHADRPYQDRAGLQHWFQTFRTDLQEKFVADQLASDLQKNIDDRQPFEDHFILKK